MSTPPLDYSHVPRLLAPATDLTGTQPVARAVSFPASGGVQFVDALGAVVNPATLTGAALLAATQTFTGFNTFAPGNATRAAGSPSFDVDMTATQTLSATLNVTQFGVRFKAPVFDKVIGQPDLDGAATVYISGAPTGTATTTAQLVALYVESGMTLLSGATRIGAGLTVSGVSLLNADTTVDGKLIVTGDAEVRGNLAFQNGYTITDSQANSAIITSSGNDYMIQVRNTGTLRFNVGVGGTVEIGDAATSLVGFYGHPAIAQQTGVAVTAPGIHAALVALGLITA